MVSKVTSFLNSWLIRSCVQTGCSKCACATLLQCNIMQHNALHTLSQHYIACMYLDLHDWKSKLGASGGERSEPPCLYYKVKIGCYSNNPWSKSIYQVFSITVHLVMCCYSDNVLFNTLRVSQDRHLSSLLIHFTLTLHIQMRSSDKNLFCGYFKHSNMFW